MAACEGSIEYHKAIGSKNLNKYYRVERIKHKYSAIFHQVYVYAPKQPFFEGKKKRGEETRLKKNLITDRK